MREIPERGDISRNIRDGWGVLRMFTRATIICIFTPCDGDAQRKRRRRKASRRERSGFLLKPRWLLAKRARGSRGGGCDPSGAVVHYPFPGRKNDSSRFRDCLAVGAFP